MSYLKLLKNIPNFSITSFCCVNKTISECQPFENEQNEGFAAFWSIEIFYFRRSVIVMYHIASYHIAHYVCRLLYGGWHTLEFLLISYKFHAYVHEIYCCLQLIACFILCVHFNFDGEFSTCLWMVRTTPFQLSIASEIPYIKK